MNNAEVTPHRACHRPIRTVRGLWQVKGATGGKLPIAGEDLLQSAARHPARPVSPPRHHDLLAQATRTAPPSPRHRPAHSTTRTAASRHSRLPAPVTARHGQTTFHASRLSPILALCCAFKIQTKEQKHRLEHLRGRFHQLRPQFLTRRGHMQHASSHPARLKHRLPVSSHLNEKKSFLHMFGPHKRPTYGHAAKTHAKIPCRVTLLTMLDSPYGDVRLSRARSLRGHPAFSQVPPQRALARKNFRIGDPMRM